MIICCNFSKNDNTVVIKRLFLAYFLFIVIMNVSVEAVVEKKNEIKITLCVVLLVIGFLNIQHKEN
jgi:hypothetical protein